MSSTLSTADLVKGVQDRTGIGLSNSFCMDRLNEQYRWICQRGNMSWLLTSATVVATSTSSAAPGYSPVTFPLPGNFDKGAPYALSGDITAGQALEIPFVQWDEALHQQFYNVGAGVSEYACWSFIGSTGRLFPNSSAASSSHVFVYHLNPGTPLAVGTTVYFPTPDAFDSMLVQMAVASIMGPEWYSMVGWDVLQKASQDSALALLDRYRTTKVSMIGMVDQGKRAQELAAERAQ